MQTTAQKTAKLAVYIALAFIFSYIESLIPLPIPFPGVKLGFANLVIIVVLYQSGFAAAFGVSLIRNILNALTFGNLFALFYSIAGSILSLLIMEGLRRLKPFHISIISVSSIGGIVHNMGQMLVASILVGGYAILHYFPFLYFAGLIAGLFIGILGKLCLERLPLPENLN